SLRIGRAAVVVFALVTVAGAVFTFAHFGSNQNLKTHLLTRTTQARQHFKVIQLVLDFDRHGYSALLGGGDTNDRNAGVKPPRGGVRRDGVDNNSTGGDLTEDECAQWYRERTALHTPSAPVSGRLNVIYIFIDALRADHLGVYGYERNTSPAIDRLASRSIVFDNAFS